MKSVLLLLCLISLVPGFSMFSAGSPYGQESPSSSPIESGMGHVGTALGDSLHFSSKNPATLGSVKRTLFMMSYRQEYTYLRDESPNTYKDFKQDIPHIALAFPLGRLGNIAASYVGHLNYDFSYIGSGSGATSDTFKTAGSLYSMDISFSRRVTSFINIGFSYNTYAGRDSTWLLQNFGGDFNNFTSLQSEKTIIRDETFTGGVLLNYRDFNLGASFQNSARTNVQLQRQIKTLYGDQTTAQKSTLTPEFYDIPAAMNLGIAGKTSDRLLLAGDLNVKFWHFSDESLRNSYHVGFGTEFRAKQKAKGSILRRSVYRLGVHHYKWYNDDIRENSLTAGMGIPLPHPTQLLNMSLEGGQRGRISKNGLKEQFFKLSLGIRASGKWGVRARKD
jgi:hypothetical protein